MKPSNPLADGLQLATRLLANGQAMAAIETLSPLMGHHSRHPALRQMIGVAYRRIGDVPTAQAHLLAAVAYAPSDPLVLNSAANALSGEARRSEAIALYRRAVALAPDYLDARLNLAMELRCDRQFAEAREEIGLALRAEPDHIPLRRALALTLIDLGLLEEAAVVLGRIVADAPGELGSLVALANVEADRGADAEPFFRAAAAIDSADEDVILGHAAALHRKGRGEEAIAELEHCLERRPDWLRGLAAAAQLRWQWREDDDFAAGYGRALAASPRNPAIWADLLSALVRAGRHVEALHWTEASRKALAQPDAFLLVEAVGADETGDRARAANAFAALNARGVADTIPQVRHLLRNGEVEAAALACERQVKAGNVEAWPYLSLAWRKAGDSRHPWLENVPEAVLETDLGLKAEELEWLAAELRARHAARAAPFDQSIRGGVQTDGNLFALDLAPVRTLRKRAVDAVHDYVRRLPSHRDGHPLLGRARDRWRLGGSWSVLLRPGGHHGSHTHPHGWLSSAFYVQAPIEEESATAGNLAFGEAPPELKLELPATRLVTPEVGKLVVFPSYTWHGTRPLSRSDRLSVAFDII